MITTTACRPARAPRRSGPRPVRRFFLGLALLGLAGAAPRLAAQSTLPDRLTDAEFWKLVTDFSEPPGYFRSENFTSNETGFQVIIPELLQRIKPGGVYLGVGPEQNFTYIVALQPKLAFITDIRRQNLLQHLIYKSMMERSETRADFLSRLFSRPRPAGLDTNSTPQALFAAYGAISADSTRYRSNLAETLEHLTKKHAFVLSDSDKAGISHVIEAFHLAGTSINYNYVVGGGSSRPMVNYAVLMQATDGTGLNRGYLATEANYRKLRDMEMRNAIIPVVGNFGGPKALRAIGTYLTEHKATVTTFYCSNVEQYLFPSNAGGMGDGGWREFYGSVATLPMDSSSTFIRSGGGGRGGMVVNSNGGGGRVSFGNGMGTSLLAPMQAIVAAFKAGQIATYQDVLGLSRP